jgi:hypothetical protein
MIEWIQSNQTLLWWLAASSVILFIATMVAVPLWAVRIPADYFADRTRQEPAPSVGNGSVQALVKIGRNLLGSLLVMIGILMLVLPGQGLLTILIGIMVMQFRAKYRIERWIVARPPVLHSMNWLRQRAGHEPLILNDN